MCFILDFKKSRNLKEIKLQIKNMYWSTINDVIFMAQGHTLYWVILTGVVHLELKY